jgi:hypothetical protein
MLKKGGGVKVKLCDKNNYTGDVKHKPRDNSFGVTWCIRCGRLFNKPCGIPLKESEIECNT